MSGILSEWAYLLTVVGGNSPYRKLRLAPSGRSVRLQPSCPSSVTLSPLCSIDSQSPAGTAETIRSRNSVVPYGTPQTPRPYPTLTSRAQFCRACGAGVGAQGQPCGPRIAYGFLAAEVWRMARTRTTLMEAEWRLVFLKRQTHFLHFRYVGDDNRVRPIPLK